MNKSRFSLAGKTAIVTGVSGLLGRKHCKALHELGAKVVAIDIFNKLNDADSIPHDLYVAADVTSKSDLIDARGRILEHFDAIHILVNNAAVNDSLEGSANDLSASKFENFPLDVWEKSLSVNLTGIFLCCQIFGTHMAEHGYGSIINIGSTYGLVGPDQSIYVNDASEQMFFKGPAYPTTKGGVINFTRFLAAYWGDKGVRVNSLSPGGVENGQDESFVRNYFKRVPLNRMANDEDYMGAIQFLASDASSYMTGSNLVIDGGWTCI